MGETNRQFSTVEVRVQERMFGTDYGRVINSAIAEAIKAADPQAAYTSHLTRAMEAYPPLSPEELAEITDGAEVSNG